MTKFVRWRILALQYFVHYTISTFVNNIKNIENGTWRDELINKDNEPLICFLRDFRKTKVYSRRDIVIQEINGENILKGLLDIFVKGLFINREPDEERRLLPIISNSIKHAIMIECGKKDPLEADDYHRLRMIVDYISGMTDSFALRTFRSLCGS